ICRLAFPFGEGARRAEEDLFIFSSSSADRQTASPLSQSPGIERFNSGGPPSEVVVPKEHYVNQFIRHREERSDVAICS
nr:hypothetical protein [Anaerolineaceae bacterium]